MLRTVFIFLIFRGFFGGGGMPKWIPDLCSTGKQREIERGVGDSKARKQTDRQMGERGT